MCVLVFLGVPDIFAHTHLRYIFLPICMNLYVTLDIRVILHAYVCMHGCEFLCFYLCMPI